MSEAGAPSGACVPGGSRYGPRWYCAWTHRKEEERGLRALTQQGFQAYLPLRLDPRTRDIGCLFPGYLFARFDVDRDMWGPIRHSSGIGRLICGVGGRPVPLPQAVIEDFMCRTSERGIVDDPGDPPQPDRTTPIPSGAAVLLASGAMIGLTGICQWSDSKRVRLLLEILGRGVAVTVPRASVEAV